MLITRIPLGTFIGYFYYHNNRPIRNLCAKAVDAQC